MDRDRDAAGELSDVAQAVLDAPRGLGGIDALLGIGAPAARIPEFEDLPDDRDVEDDEDDLDDDFDDDLDDDEDDDDDDLDDFDEDDLDDFDDDEDE